MATITAQRPQAPAWGAPAAIEERYRPLVAELEALAARDPDGYRRRVILRAWLGYSYIALMMAVLALVVAAIVGMMIMSGHAILIMAKPLLFLGVALFGILKALWVTVPPPEGFPVTRRDAPALFDLIDEVRSCTGGPRPDQVMITPDFNAAIVQQPRLGIFGWHRNYVLLGMPLLLALPRDEVAAVIGHEYGHLAGAHGKTGGWIYRVRVTWLRLSESLGGGWIGRIFQRFFKWYGPWFNAYSFVLARSNEYQADRASADIGGSGLAARALARVSVESHRYNRFWARLFEVAGRDEEALSFRMPVWPIISSVPWTTGTIARPSMARLRIPQTFTTPIPA